MLLHDANSWRYFMMILHDATSWYVPGSLPENLQQEPRAWYRGKPVPTVRLLLLSFFYQVCLISSFAILASWCWSFNISALCCTNDLFNFSTHVRSWSPFFKRFPRRMQSMICFRKTSFCPPLLWLFKQKRILPVLFMIASGLCRMKYTLFLLMLVSTLCVWTQLMHSLATVSHMMSGQASADCSEHAEKYPITVLRS